MPWSHARCGSLGAALFLLSLVGMASCETGIRIGVPTPGGLLPVEITLSPNADPSQVTVELDGLDVTASFAPGGAGLLGSVPLPAPGSFRISVKEPLGMGGGRMSRSSVFESAAAAPAFVSVEPSQVGGPLPIERSDWLRLRFASPLSESQIGSWGFSLECNGARIPRTHHLLADGALILNPAPELPPGSSCRVAWRGVGGNVEQRTFSVALDAPGAPRVALYDRGDPFQMAPFPDDYWTLPDASLPSGVGIQFPVPPFTDPLQVQAFQALLAQTQGVDGWSRQPPIVLAFSHALSSTVMPADLAAAQDPMAAIWLVDVDPQSPDYGRRIPYEMMLRNDLAPDFTTDHVAILFPSIDLREQGQYVVVVTRRAVATPTTGNPFGPSAFFAEVLSDPDPGDGPELVKARQSIVPALDALAALPDVPLPPEDVALAVRISVRTHPSVADMVHIKELALASPPPQLILPDVTVNPCPAPDFCIQTSFDRGLIVRARIELPDFRNGELVFERDPVTSLPVQTGVSSVPVVISLPFQALGGPVAPVMYQHGNPGHPSEMLAEFTNGHLDDAGFALIGMQDTLNREIGQDIGLQTVGFLFNLILNGKLPDFWNQTGADMIHFLRAIQGLDSLDLMRPGAGGLPEVGSDGVPEIDPSVILYKGISEGSNNAQRFLPFAPEVLAAAATVGAARLPEIMLLDSADGLLAQVGGLMPEIRPVELWIGVSLVQVGYDSQDGHTFLRHLYRQPLTPFAGSSDTTPPSSIWTEGIGDPLSNGIRAAAVEIGIPHVRRVQVQVPTLPQVDPPLAGNLGPGLTGGFFQFDPPNTPSCVLGGWFDPHDCAQVSTEAQAQRLHFYQSALTGAAEIIDPLP